MLRASQEGEQREKGRGKEEREGNMKRAKEQEKKSSFPIQRRSAKSDNDNLKLTASRNRQSKNLADTGFEDLDRKLLKMNQKTADTSSI